ncbi:Crp/Fnr family transcriptional regulator [Verminephrobacter eiseniae]|uniref:Crp/Fnr family transcriptional regulator n=1 Tax=Verminephrobacter eiseniae TaxID=364317 RepID=UPI0010D06C72|nr:cyclic nucleotide-binding domain-containing protein [Verminephrobacter eiseniae]KAB7604216.1 cyclic nucleotide-binding domain-containing protein [Verminephrobacter sp. Larva24]MCW5234443.1 cyclic nucleotide-binding domain-containing protein [Verminephrobacter eiseniae]MCW5293981.1 cyclic nucleotide-binding domain-containing protein [Verminephrobacter eiseniae]MCW8186743.1 cyclic nucleotide-binding domain-containing protein [Verminephrobacter eiseniae]MCW8225229.1 cyclic nucleotide-binding d
MKGILSLLRTKPRKTQPASPHHTDSMLFASAFAHQGVDDEMLVPWEARAVEVGAQRLSTHRGGKLLRHLWAKDKYMAQLDKGALARVERFFEFATIAAHRDVIRQDEYGNFLVVVLTGTMAIDRIQPWGKQRRLAEAQPGDMLGEMSLLDSGSRFSACATLTPCEVAVLSAEAMDEMMNEEPQLAASLVTLLARKLSLRLRAVSANLSDNQE